MSRTHAPAAFVAAFALALSGAALAQNDFDPVMSEQDAPEVTFEQLDTDGDGYVIKSDIPAEHELAVEFATADTNRDSRLDRAEFNAFIDQPEEEEAEE
jgi:hypothetical protein